MIQAARGVVSIYDTVRLAGQQAVNSGPALFRPGTKLLLFCEVGSPPLPSLSSQLATAEQSVQFCSGFPRLKLFFAKENASTTIIHPGRRTSITPSIRSSSTTCGFTLQVLDDVLDPRFLRTRSRTNWVCFGIRGLRLIHQISVPALKVQRPHKSSRCRSNPFSGAAFAAAPRALRRSRR